MIHLALACGRVVDGIKLEGDFACPSSLNSEGAREMLEFAIEQMGNHYIVIDSEIAVTEERVCHIMVVFAIDEDYDFDAQTTTGLLESYFNDYLREKR